MVFVFVSICLNYYFLRFAEFTEVHSLSQRGTRAAVPVQSPHVARHCRRKVVGPRQSERWSAGTVFGPSLLHWGAKDVSFIKICWFIFYCFFNDEIQGIYPIILTDILSYYFFCLSPIHNIEIIFVTKVYKKFPKSWVRLLWTMISWIGSSTNPFKLFSKRSMFCLLLQWFYFIAKHMNNIVNIVYSSSNINLKKRN